MKVVREGFIVAIYFLEQMNSPRCWRTIEQANYFYKELKSETARLHAVKGQILIRYLGCGWIEAHHPWSMNGTTYTSSYLFKFLKDTVIPLEKKMGGIPKEPPLEIPSPPEMMKMGKKTDLAMNFKTAGDKDLEQFRREARTEQDEWEARGGGDRYSEMQPSVQPKFDKLEGCKIKMLFDEIDADGNACLEWSHGVVKSVVNVKAQKVEIKWDDVCIHPDERESMKITVDVLAVRKWNPDVAVKGGWRLYLAK